MQRKHKAKALSYMSPPMAKTRFDSVALAYLRQIEDGPSLPAAYSSLMDRQAAIKNTALSHLKDRPQ